MSFIAFHLLGVLAKAGIYLPLLFLSGAWTYNKPLAMTTRKPWRDRTILFSVESQSFHGWRLQGVQGAPSGRSDTHRYRNRDRIRNYNDFASPCDCVILPDMTFDFDHNCDFDTDSDTKIWDQNLSCFARSAPCLDVRSLLFAGFVSSFPILGRASWRCAATWAGQPKPLNKEL